MPDTDANVPWSTTDVALAIVLLVPLTIFLTALLYFLGFAVLRLTIQSVPKSLPLVSTGTAAFISSAGLAWFFGVKRHRATFADIGFKGLKVWQDLPLAVMGQILAFVGIAAYTLFLQLVVRVKVPRQLGAGDFGASVSGFILALLIIVVLAPLGEEMFFRGFVYPALRQEWGVLPAMTATSAVFAVFHMHPLLFLPMFIIGMVLATLFEFRGSLAPNIMMHALNNLIALLSVYGLF